MWSSGVDRTGAEARLPVMVRECAASAQGKAAGVGKRDREVIRALVEEMEQSIWWLEISFQGLAIGLKM
jgi:hypothetical protein